VCFVLCTLLLDTRCGVWGLSQLRATGVGISSVKFSKRPRKRKRKRDLRSRLERGIVDPYPLGVKLIITFSDTHSQSVETSISD
jgi:hypothetical protein